MRWAEHTESTGEARNAYTDLMGKLDGKEPKNR
jgi:hypothetical protein